MNIDIEELAKHLAKKQFEDYLWDGALSHLKMYKPGHPIYPGSGIYTQDLSEEGEKRLEQMESDFIEVIEKFEIK